MDAGQDSCVMKQATERETIDGCRFDPGDFMLAVKWFSRDTFADPQGRTFYPAEKGVLNSTELRYHGFELTKLTGGPTNNSSAAGGALQSLNDDSNDDTPFAVLLDSHEMCPKLEQCILSKCW